MNRFAPVLARLNQRLVLPQPLKYRIMKEIAADLEDTFEAYKLKGFDEGEAESKAVEKVAADDRVINDLIEVHESPARKILRRLSDKAQYRMEAGLLISIIVLAVIMVSAVITRSQLLAGSPFNWLTGGCIIWMFGISVAKYYELFVKRDHTMQKIHRGLSLLIFMSCLVILTGMIGFFVEIHKSVHVGVMHGTDNNIALSHLIKGFAVISLSLATSVIGAIIWLIMILKTLSVEDCEHTFHLQV